MVQLLNKKIAFTIVFFLGIFIGTAQQEIEEQYHVTKDYKDPQQFEKFRKRRIVIGAWQINQLKQGAMVVKLQTGLNQVKALSNVGLAEKAIEKKVTNFIVNKNIMMAYIDKFKFCKLYFIYSNSVDSLRNGAKSGMFLDTNLAIDPTITMNESFYILAEKDFVYNSSIGFVKEDSAKFVSEHGNPSAISYDIVLKNKYGHQLKSPFPYAASFTKKLTGYLGPIPMYYKYEDNIITYTVDKKEIEDMKLTEGKRYKPAPKGFKTIFVGKNEVYEFIRDGIEYYNDKLNQYYQFYPPPDLTRVDPTVLPFLY